MLRDKPIRAIELSALREAELRPLVEGLETLDLSAFEYIAVHAPSQYPAPEEDTIVRLLAGVARRGWPIVLHPDAVHDFARWRPFGHLLCVENMDKRKPIGRTADELQQIFDFLPEASFCFDIGHARQIDSTMTEAYFLLKRFGNRLRQVHLSEVNTRSKHDRLSYASILAFREVAAVIPENTPIILETPVLEGQIATEIDQAATALPLAEPELVQR